MKRIRPETRRRIAGIVAIVLIAAMVLSSVSVLFVDAYANITVEESYEE